MTERGKRLLIIGLLGALSLTAGFIVGRRPPGDPAPDAAALLASASFRDLQNRPFRLSEQSSKPRLVNFWATWCAPCLQEMPLLNRFHQAHIDQLEVVGIAVDEPAPVAKFVERAGIVFPIALGDFATLDLLKKLGDGPGGLPFSVVLNRQGEIVDTYIGALDEADLAAALIAAGQPK